MRRACERYDQALLMLVHGELGPRQSLAPRAHLALCPACRERRRRLEGVTRSLATVLANPRLGMRRLSPGRVVWASVGLLVALFAVLGLLVSSKVSAASGTTAIPTPVVPHTHCEAR